MRSVASNVATIGGAVAVVPDRGIYFTNPAAGGLVEKIAKGCEFGAPAPPILLVGQRSLTRVGAPKKIPEPTRVDDPDGGSFRGLEHGCVTGHQDIRTTGHSGCDNPLVVRVRDPQVEMLLRSCDDGAFAQQRFDLSDRLLAELDLDAELPAKFVQDDLPDDELVLQQDVRE